MYVYPYRMGSRSASSLAEALGARQIKHERSKFRGGEGKTVINWGAGELPPEVLRSRVLNKVGPVNIARDKLRTFTALSGAGVSIPPFTRSADEAITWIERGSVVVARRTLTGHSGQGIEILQKGLDFVQAPMYTKYIPKTAEYRVHVVRQRNGEYEIIDIQRKVKDPERDVQDWKVRSHQNGFIFVRHDDRNRSYRDVCETQCKEQAKAAMRALGLDFGGVDVIFNKKAGQAYVLEINTACGLEGQSVEIYANALRGL